MPYPETDGIRYFFASPRYAADSPYKRGQLNGCPLGALRRELACILPKRIKKSTHMGTTGLRPRVPSRLL